MAESGDIRKREKVAREIEKTSDAIRKKHRALKTGQIDDDIALDRYFRPIVQPLQKIVDQSTIALPLKAEPIKIEPSKIEHTMEEAYFTQPRHTIQPLNQSVAPLQSVTPPPAAIEQTMVEPKSRMSRKRIAQKEVNFTQPRRMRQRRTIQYLDQSTAPLQSVTPPPALEIEQTTVEPKKRVSRKRKAWAETDYTEPMGKRQRRTMQPLDQSTPSLPSIMPPAEIEQEMVEPESRVSRKRKARELADCIQPNIKRQRCTKKSGRGLPRTMTLNDNAIDYVHWDDPNELVDRLRLFEASHHAGHNAHDNEIMSIIEELCEAGLIIN